MDPTTGVTIFRGNTADMKGKGVDIVLRSKNINKQFKWFSTLLFSYTSDKVTTYKVPQSAIWYYCDPGYISPIEGRPLYSIYSFKWMGLGPQTGDPRGYYNKETSKNYSEIINSAELSDLIYRGPANPTYFGSLRNNFSYKQLELSFTITWKMGYYFRRNSIDYYNLFNGPSQDIQIMHCAGKNLVMKMYTSVPSMVPNASPTRSTFYEYSDVLIEKGDHIRLQDIQLSYQLNKKEIRWLPMNQFRLYIYMPIIWGFFGKPIIKALIRIIFQDIPNPRTIAAGLRIDF